MYKNVALIRKRIFCGFICFLTILSACLFYAALINDDYDTSEFVEYCHTYIDIGIKFTLAFCAGCVFAEARFIKIGASF
jgi:hypothetical protein